MDLGIRYLLVIVVELTTAELSTAILVLFVIILINLSIIIS